MQVVCKKIAQKLIDNFSTEELLVIDDLLKEVMSKGTTPGQTISESIHLNLLQSNKISLEFRTLEQQLQIDQKWTNSVHLRN